MRRVIAAYRVAAFTLLVAVQLPLEAAAQVKASAKASAPLIATSAPTAIPAAIKDLPVRQVVLYKNGVGYATAARAMSSNQRVTIDFTSSQLNDVLQSLTALDRGGGRIAGVDANSTTPIEQQLKALAAGLKDYPATIAVSQALRERRVEVTGAGASLLGRLASIEFRKEVDKNGQAWRIIIF